MIKKIAKSSSILTLCLLLAVSVTTNIMVHDKAFAAACTAPSTDYGTVTQTVSISTAGTYYFWLRMSAPDSSSNTVLVDVDSTTCYTAGGSTVPTYSSGATTYFSSGISNWINKTSSGTVISQNLSTGSHTIKLIGTSTGLVVDRMILTSDDSCSPKGVGDNCSVSFLAADINMNGKVDFLDFSVLASKYSQSGSSLGRSDINGDNTVNFLDYSIFANKYGQ